MLLPEYLNTDIAKHFWDEYQYPLKIITQKDI